MSGSTRTDDGAARKPGSAGEVFAAFLKLGLTSFGGPIAHLGYFRRELVERRGWVNESQYAQLLAITQFLPGPASSQLGFSLGLLRAGWGGAVAAFLGFTLPSALALFAFAMFLPRIAGGAAGAAAIHGLKLVALAVVAHGVLGMARRLTPDWPRALIALAAAALCLTVAGAGVQLAVVAFGALAGLALHRHAAPTHAVVLEVPYGPRAAAALLAAFALLLALSLAAAHAAGSLLAVAGAFYRAGALVFGGGHVVLPLLQELVVAPGWIAPDDFLAGYGAAQAVPGPLFTLAAFLGARLSGGAGGGGGAAIALLSVFLPGLLLVAGVLPLWRAIASRPGAARAIAGVNAAVVGLLGAALYRPLWLTAVGSPFDVAIAGLGFVALAVWNIPPLAVVAWCMGASLATGAWVHA